MSAAPATTALSTALVVDGFGVVEAVLDAAQCAALVAAIEANADAFAPRRWLDCDAVAAVAAHLATMPALMDALPTDAVALQCTLFDKSAGRDWSVGPHQDLAMPAAALPLDLAHTLPRTVKDGLDVVQPPTCLLESLLAVRVQLDATADGAGALEVFPGTHRRNRLTDAELQALDPRKRVRIDVPRGGALLMRPLLVHTSRRLRTGCGSDVSRDVASLHNHPAKNPTRRRVLHFLFAPRMDSRRTFARETHTS